MKTKRVLSIFIVTAVLVILLAISAFAKTTGVTSGQANVRSGPGKSHSLVYKNLPSGVSLEILETVNSDDGSKPWHHINFTFNGKAYSGYISSGYVNNISYSDDNNNGTYTTEIPKEYASYISALKVKHPNWTFKFYNTGLEWSDVVKGETKPGISAISGTKPISYRSTSYNFKKEGVTGYVYGYYIKIDGATATVINTDGNLNVRDGIGTSKTNIICSIPAGTVVDCLGFAGTDEKGRDWYKISIDNGYTFTPIEGSSWYQAHGQVVQYYLDPRKFLDEQSVFMFENLGFDSSAHTVAGVQSILAKAAWAKGTVQTTDGRSISYAEAFYEAGKKYGVSPYHLASRAVQEVGASGSDAAWGSNSSYKGIYNFYSIGANTGMMDGLNWASQSGNYGRPWNTAYKSIVGGAEFIAKGYISVGQSSLYFQKFDVIASGGLYNHQYMSNVSAPASESINVYKGYDNINCLDSNFEFVIPVYKNMPILACKLPVSSNTPNMEKDTDIAFVFPDVFSGDWYYNAVRFNVEKGYITGYSNGTFGPANNIQRQDFVLILARIAGADLSAYEGQNGGFSDVQAGTYYASAVAWAKDKGVVNGYSSDYFGVGTYISREQICLIFSRYLGGEATGDVDAIVQAYPDGGNTSSWAKAGVAWAIENGIVGNAGYINPTGNAGRAEVAQIIYNMANKGMI